MKKKTCVWNFHLRGRVRKVLTVLYILVYTLKTNARLQYLGVCHAMHSERIQRVQRSFLRYAFFCLERLNRTRHS